MSTPQPAKRPSQGSVWLALRLLAAQWRQEAQDAHARAAASGDRGVLAAEDMAEAGAADQHAADLDQVLDAYGVGRPGVAMDLDGNLVGHVTPDGYLVLRKEGGGD